jgi:hypothetical protein
MPRFRFSLGTTDGVREVGVVQSDSFAAALERLGEELSAYEGDTLEIGVTGFPPARYEFVLPDPGSAHVWRPSRLIAA